jgi:hypothetical protein
LSAIRSSFHTAHIAANAATNFSPLHATDVTTIDAAHIRAHMPTKHATYYSTFVAANVPPK